MKIRNQNYKLIAIIFHHKRISSEAKLDLLFIMRREEKDISHYALTTVDAPFHNQLIRLFTSADSMVKQVEERLSKLTGTEEQRHKATMEFDRIFYYTNISLKILSIPHP